MVFAWFMLCFCIGFVSAALIDDAILSVVVSVGIVSLLYIIFKGMGVL